MILKCGPHKTRCGGPNLPGKNAAKDEAIAGTRDQTFAWCVVRGAGGGAPGDMVGAAGIEPATPSMSTKCSPTELRAPEECGYIGKCRWLASLSWPAPFKAPAKLAGGKTKPGRNFAIPGL